MSYRGRKGVSGREAYSLSNIENAANGSDFFLGKTELSLSLTQGASTDTSLERLPLLNYRGGGDDFARPLKEGQTALVYPITKPLTLNSTGSYFVSLIGANPLNHDGNYRFYKNSTLLLLLLVGDLIFTNGAYTPIDITFPSDTSFSPGDVFVIQEGLGDDGENNFFMYFNFS